MGSSLALSNKNTLVNQISKCFNKWEVNEMAVASGFVKRKSKLSGIHFLMLNIFAHQQDEKMSLEGLSRVLLKEEIEITKQSLHQRYNKEGVHFMSQMLGKVLQQRLSIPKQKMDPVFKRVILSDATSIQLPDQYQNKYKGNGGSASKSSMKVQYNYDMLSGTILMMSTLAGSSPDAKTPLGEVKKTTYEYKI